MNQNEYDHSRFDDIFGGQNDYEDVSLESALAASKMQPTAKPAEIEGDDHTSGYVIPVMEITVEDDASPIVKYLRSVKWTREIETDEDFELTPNHISSSYYGGFQSGDNGHVWKNEDGEWCYCFSGVSDDGNYYEGDDVEGFATKAEAVADMMDAYRNY